MWILLRNTILICLSFFFSFSIIEAKSLSQNDKQANKTVVYQKIADTKEKIRKKRVFLKITREWLSKAYLSDRVSKRLLEHIYDMSVKRWLDPYLVFSVIYAESTFQPKLYNFCCYWLMQVSKYSVNNYNDEFDTWYNLKDDMFDSFVNINVWTHELARAVKSQGWSEQLALLVYNWWHGYLRRMQRAWTINTYYTNKVLRLRDKLNPY